MNEDNGDADKSASAAVDDDDDNDKNDDVDGHFLIINKSSKCILKHFMFLEAH